MFYFSLISDNSLIVCYLLCFCVVFPYSQCYSAMTKAKLVIAMNKRSECLDDYAKDGGPSVP